MELTSYVFECAVIQKVPRLFTSPQVPQLWLLSLKAIDHTGAGSQPVRVSLFYTPRYLVGMTHQYLPPSVTPLSLQVVAHLIPVPEPL